MFVVFFVVLFAVSLLSEARMCQSRDGRRRDIPNCAKCGKTNPKCKRCENGFRLAQGRRKCVARNTNTPTTPPTTTPTTPPTTTPPTQGGSQKSQWLNEHNKRRTKYLKNQFGVSGNVDVTWSNELASSAQRHANKLAKNQCRLQHAQGNFGENLAAQGPSANIGNILTRWTENEELRRKGQQWNLFRNGHFTQVIWRGTKKIGCAVATGSGCSVAVCRYSVPGNCGISPNNWFDKVTAPSSFCGSLVSNAEETDGVTEELESVDGDMNVNHAGDNIQGWQIGLLVIGCMVVLLTILLVVVLILKR